MTPTAERFWADYERPDQVVFRFGYYILNVEGNWTRPQANPMFDSADWMKIMNAVEMSGMTLPI